VLETVLIRRESDCKRLSCVQPNSSSVWHTRLSGGAPNSVRCARLVRVNSPLSGFDGSVWLKITGPSGGAPDCPVSHLRRTRRSREKDQRCMTKIHRTIRWCTGLSGEPTVTSANGRPQNRRATCGSSNGRQGHRTVRFANGPGAATVNCARFGRQSRTGQATVVVFAKKQPRRISVSPEAPLQRRTYFRLARGPAFAKKQP
jgi:hypothetical protein